MSEFLCPCCKNKMPTRPEARHLLALKFSPVETSLMRLVIRYYPNPVPLERLVDYIYAGTSNGGPETARQTITVLLSRLRKKLTPAGWTITTNAGGRGVIGEYTLEPLMTGT